MMRVYMESLGCARNQVDSEVMSSRLQGAGCQLIDDPAAAEVIVVNTCSFIASAADESIDAILALADHKGNGRCRQLIVTGCLPERYRTQITKALPEVDLFLGTGAYDRIVAAVEGKLSSGTCLLPDPDTINIHDTQSGVIRQPSTRHAAYLKIAEGCSRHCTYCVIPKLRGRQKSRPLEAILQEARSLIAAGAKELTLVAQETTAYGHDLNQGTDLARLLDALAKLDPTVWIRFLYGHPESITGKMLETLSVHANICSYVDIPIQHASDTILRRMGRAYTADDLQRLFDTIRVKVPDVALRTTVLVGFPGEADADFERLKEFTQQVGFDHLGVFAYSDAEDLPSHRLDGHVAAGVAQARLDELMAQQQALSAHNLTRYQGQRLEALVEGRREDGLWSGRTMYQAPEVDGMMLIRNADQLCKGRFVQVRIVETLDYDLIAEVL